MGNWLIIVFMYAIIQIELNEKNRTARTTEMVKMHVNLPHRHTDTHILRWLFFSIVMRFPVMCWRPCLECPLEQGGGGLSSISPGGSGWPRKTACLSLKPKQRHHTHGLLRRGLATKDLSRCSIESILWKIWRAFG